MTNPPTTASPAPSKKNQPPIDQRGTDTTPVKILPGPDDQKASKVADHSKEKAEEEKRLTDAALALATILLAVFTFLLWLATYRLAKDAKETAFRQALQVQNSLTIAREEFISTHRPKLTIRNIQIDHASRKVNFDIVNIGGTTARLHELSTRLWLPGTAALPQIPPYPEGTHPDISIDTGQICPMTHQVTQEEMDEYLVNFGLRNFGIERTIQSLPIVFTSHASIMCFFGYVAYEDSLHRRFRTAFLRLYDFGQLRFKAVDDAEFEYQD